MKVIRAINADYPWMVAMDSGTPIKGFEHRDDAREWMAYTLKQQAESK